ncbi:hypothetical protein [Vibrio agarivorans]|uniref:Uncharacterized protein n=1 Tax=Vibrio agarivorans TaxID=153622 RepID=A0ABT7Y723_9VIBR|nr:hypothetical protein [Vibrio agarivorans]MDN2483846.1 hypothetical protein [Vibrio agarivorans]
MLQAQLKRILASSSTRSIEQLKVTELEHLKIIDAALESDLSMTVKDVAGRLGTHRLTTVAQRIRSLRDLNYFNLLPKVSRSISNKVVYSVPVFGGESSSELKVDARMYQRPPHFAFESNGEITLIHKPLFAPMGSKVALIDSQRKLRLITADNDMKLDGVFEGVVVGSVIRFN